MPNAILSSELSRLSLPRKKELLAELAQRRATREARRRLWTYYPNEGPLRRELYPKHLEFFAAGAEHQERAFIAGNRTGKTFAACYEATLHLTGAYPEWWEGWRFARPIVCWAAGEDAKAVRESIQRTLLGPPEAMGTGLIPGDRMGKPRMRGGIPEAVDFVTVTSERGGESQLLFKAYEQGRESFQAAKVDLVILDEEPPLSIYTEALTRTMSTVPGEPNGRVMCSFTPLRGLSETVLQFLPGGAIPATVEARKAAWGW